MHPVKIQISLYICPVWSEFSLGTFWIAKDANFLHENIRRLSLDDRSASWFGSLFGTRQKVCFLSLWLLRFLWRNKKNISIFRWKMLYLKVWVNGLSWSKVSMSIVIFTVASFMNVNVWWKYMNWKSELNICTILSLVIAGLFFFSAPTCITCIKQLNFGLNRLTNLIFDHFM